MRLTLLGTPRSLLRINRLIASRLARHSIFDATSRRSTRWTASETVRTTVPGPNTSLKLETREMRVVVRGLCKAYRDTPALVDCSLEIPAGRLVAVLGSNGAGKTTLLRCLAAVAAPDQGEILYDGQPFSRRRLDLRKRLLFLADPPYYYPHYTVLQHLAVVLKAYEVSGAGLEELLVGLLREFDLLLAVESPMGELSKGQAYKACLVAALVIDPDLWLIDEPFASGLDPHGLTILRERLRSAASRGKTILYSTQILEVADKFSDLICVLHRGSVHALGEPAELEHAPGLTELFAELHEPSR